MNATIVVIGVGNPYRRDDGVGPAVVHLLRARGVPDAILAESDGDPASLICHWSGRRLAVVVDAIRADPPHPGRVHRLVVPRPAAERARAASSHGMDLGDTVELARELGHLPDRMVLFGVEVADVGFGVGLTPAVADAAGRLAAEIAAEVAALDVAAAACATPSAPGANAR